jgi:UDP-2,3-diacylglucosamine pyrophosphatase LpxH
MSISIKTTRRETFKALDEALADAQRVDAPSLAKGRFVVFSDIHRGDGKTGSDDFRHNAELYLYALQHYFSRGYSIILNGDCEDCWETDPAEIVKAYRETAFDAERRFNAAGRYFRIAGNHDDDWKNPSAVDRFLAPVLGPVRVLPSLLLGGRILVLHGHQGDPHDDRHARRSRWMVRHVWAPLQRRGLTDFLWPLMWRFGFAESGRAAQNNYIRRERDQLLYEWAKANRLLLIAGHTHRGMFRSFSRIDQIRAIRDQLEGRARAAATRKERLLVRLSIDTINRVIRESRDELKRDKLKNRLDENPVPCYFNDGCCVHTNGITGIEIDRGTIRLIKWEVSGPFEPDAGRTGGSHRFFVSVERRIYQSGNLKRIIKMIDKRSLK